MDILKNILRVVLPAVMVLGPGAVVGVYSNPVPVTGGNISLHGEKPLTLFQAGNNSRDMEFDTGEPARSKEITWSLFQADADGKVSHRLFTYRENLQEEHGQREPKAGYFYNYQDQQASISKMLVNGSPVQQTADNEIQLNYSENTITFKFTAGQKNSSESFRYRLAGLDYDWVSASGSHIAEFVNLEPGNYSFLIATENESNLPAAIKIPFTISKPFWAALWFQYGMVLVVCGLLYGVVSIRKYHIIKQEMMRLRIARDLHDDLSSTLNSINFFANAIESRSLNADESKRFLKLISDSSREAKERISDIIWVIHPQDDDWETLLLKCKRYASDVLECKGISHRFVVEGSPPVKLTMALKKNTWLIFRELITNIAKHADPDNVEIRFKVENGAIQLNVNDDGKGFDPSNRVSEGYGLRNIKSRVDVLKGHVFLDSRQNSGTQWDLQLPL